MLPPGRAMLVTNPASTGSISRSIPAIAIVRVVFLAAAKAQVPRCENHIDFKVCEFRCELGEKFGLIVSGSVFEFDVPPLSVTGLA
jgi:hypothetical protein